jgi:CheY-like chemotaxis protein
VRTDDNATNRHILEEMLKSWRMQPSSVADAGAAIAALKDGARTGERFDLVVTDGQMPVVDGLTLVRWIRHDKALRATPVVLLTSMGTEDQSRTRRLDVSAYLTKPVKQSDLFDAVATIFVADGRRASARQAAPIAGQPRVTRHVLVAEDNAANRKLVTALLERRGHRVTSVENGRLAIDAIDSGRSQFDVVLMDLQMPQIGGLEATRAIRAAEPAGVRLPIVALTAHAMAGDRERCLEAGMDGYLSKPIDPDQLFAVIESTERSAAPASPRQDKRDVVFDDAGALARTGGDRRLLAEIVALFVADCRALLRQLERAVTKADADAVRNAAHSLKGAVANVGGLAVSVVAADLEEARRSGRLNDAPMKLGRLREEIDRLTEAFRTHNLLPSARSRPRPGRRRRRKR